MNKCICPFCSNSPLHTSNSCEIIRSKQAKVRSKERKRNYERKYSLKEVLSGAVSEE